MQLILNVAHIRYKCSRLYIFLGFICNSSLTLMVFCCASPVELWKVPHSRHNFTNCILILSWLYSVWFSIGRYFTAKLVSIVDSIFLMWGLGKGLTLRHNCSSQLYLFLMIFRWMLQLQTQLYKSRGLGLDVTKSSDQKDCALV